MPELQGHPTRAGHTNAARARLWRTVAQSIANSALTDVDFDAGEAGGYWADAAFSETPGAFRPRRDALSGGGSYEGPLLAIATVSWTGDPFACTVAIYLIQDGGAEILIGHARSGTQDRICQAVGTAFVTSTDRLVVRTSQSSGAPLDLNPAGAADESGGLQVYAPFAPLGE